MGTPLDRARYINLKSFKRNGDGVNTPVWCAPLDGKLVIFTLRDSYKVKRIARNAQVQVARCDARGKLLGEWLDGSCVAERTRSSADTLLVPRAPSRPPRVVEFMHPAPDSP